MAGCGGGGSCGLCAPAPTAPTILASDYRGTVPTTQRVRINWYASDWLKASMRIHLLSQRKRRSQRVGSNSGRTENAFDCALRNISICTKYPIPMPITLYMHHKVIKHPSAIRPAQIARNDSASDMLELDERLGASWQSASASAACIEKPKVAARYCA